MSSFRVAMVFGGLWASTACVWAQWPGDPAVNLSIGDRTGEQIQPKIRGTADGGCYISWFDNAAGGYDVYIQRLNALGVEQFAHNGILLADRAFSSTQDYGMSVDPAGNAVIGFRNTTTQAGVHKVAPNGALLWGPTGVSLNSVAVNAPRVAAMTDGSVVVGWTEGPGSRLQRLDASGDPLWVDGILITPTDAGSYSLGDLVAAPNGEVIAPFQHPTGPNPITSPKHLHAQKLDANGTAMWGAAPIVVFDANSMQVAYFPRAVSDGAGGAVIGWYEVGGTRRARMQHVTSAGAEMFAHNGVEGSTLTSQIQTSPDIAYDAATGDTYLFWTESNSGQSQWGVYGQRFDSAGAPQWGAHGLVLAPLSPDQNSFVRTGLDCAGNAMVYYFDRSGSSNVRGFKVSPAGAVLWAGSPIQVCSLLSGKGRLDLSVTRSGMAMLAWNDSRVDSNNIIAQNVNPAGTLGLPAFILGDMNCDGLVSVSDIGAFVLAITDATGYATAFPSCDINHADVNCDGFVTVGDIGEFVALLTS